MSDKEYIWHALLEDIGNELGVAALMGNLQAESGLVSYRLQGDFSNGYANSIEYTNKVNSGEISKSDFVNNGPGGGGYGLAQWTYPPRKEALYNMWQSGGYHSIGSVALACDFLIEELKTTYYSVYKVLRECTSIREGSDKVLHDFENPADQSESVEILRAQLGTSIYVEMKGTAPGGGGSSTTKKKKGYNFILFNQRRRQVNGQRFIYGKDIQGIKTI